MKDSADKIGFGIGVLIGNNRTCASVKALMNED